jgi:hypothetical protein
MVDDDVTGGIAADSPDAAGLKSVFAALYGDDQVHRTHSKSRRCFNSAPFLLVCEDQLTTS